MAYTVPELMKEHDISFEEMIEKTGLDDQRLKVIMMRCWTPSPEDRKKIADVFELEISEIVWGHKTPIQHIYGQGPG